MMNSDGERNSQHGMEARIDRPSGMLKLYYNCDTV